MSGLSVSHRGPRSARGGPRWSPQAHGASDGSRSLFPKVSFQNCPAGPGPLGERPAVTVGSGWPAWNPVLFCYFHVVAENRALETIPPITVHGNKPRTNETLSWAELLSLLRSKDIPLFGHLPGTPLTGSGCFTKVGEFPKPGFKLASRDGLAGRGPCAPSSLSTVFREGTGNSGKTA